MGEPDQTALEEQSILEISTVLIPFSDTFAFLWFYPIFSTTKDTETG